MALVDRLCSELGAQPVVARTVLTWEELRCAQSDGISIGAHTQTHPVLTNVSLEQARAEISGAQADIKRHIGRSYPVFCYPNGNHNRDIVAMLKGMNFAVGMTTSKGHNTLRRVDPLRLHRQNISRKCSMPVFRLRLSTVGGYLDRWRS
jgi:peptidoglycan/xylan/chitin deacetylase (PgdA/CDA1 family)